MNRYLWAHSVGHHHNVHNVTKGLITGWCVKERVKRLVGNEIEQGIGIPMIESRASIVPMDKGNCIRVWLILDIVVQPIKIFVEYVGINMGIQVLLLVIDRRRVLVMSTLFSTRRVRTLKVSMTVILWVYDFYVPKEFGVPDEIGDMTRSLEMVET